MAPPPPQSAKAEILDVAEESELGNTIALLPDGRGIAQRSGAISIVDPATGTVLGPHPAPVPSQHCSLRRWGQAPALICNSEVLYRLQGTAWQLVTRAATDGADMVQFSDDGVRAAYFGRRCPGEPPPVDGSEFQLCVFDGAAWRKAPYAGYAEILAIRGARVLVRGAKSLDVIDANTLARTSIALPDPGGRWRHGSVTEPWAYPAGFVYLEAVLENRDAVPATRIGVMQPDDTFLVHSVGDAPRERWGLHVAFADERHGVAAGSFYRHIYYTDDAGAHWTAIAGLDAARDAKFATGRLVEDSALHVHCDAARSCRIGTYPHELVVRWR
jgi:hypothetical protein